MTVIQIKRSPGVAAPTTGDLAEGELAYSQDRTNNGAGAVLYIESIASDGITSVVEKIGGKYYTNTVDEFLTPATASVGGGVEFFEGTGNGTNKIVMKAPNALTADLTYTLPITPTNGYFLQTDGSGNMSWAQVVSNITISDNQGTPNTDVLNTGETLTFAGTTNQIVTTVSDNQVAFALATDVSITGDLTVGGNDIKMSGGTTALTFSGSGDVAVAGDLQVSGNDIKMSGGTTAITMSGTGDVTVAGDLQVSGNDIKSSTGATALTLSGSDVTVAGNLTINGTSTIVNSTTVTIDDVLLKLADNNTGNSVDTGVYGQYVESTVTKYAGWFRDASDSNIFKFFVGLETEPTTTVDTTAAGYTIGTMVANLTGGTISNLTAALTVPNGGTGATTFTTNGVLYGNGTSAIQATSAGTDGYILKSASGVPTWSNTIDGGTY
jgi:hypothetical protein